MVGVPNEGLTPGISRNEVKVAISRMKMGQATGMGMGFEWKCLGEDLEGIDMLWYLIQRMSRRKCQWSGNIVKLLFTYLEEKGDIHVYT